MAKTSTKTSKYLRTAAQLLGVAAVGWACRKAAAIPPGRLQDLRNRLLLSWNFFKATQVTGTIHRVEFGFIYLDGDRSAHVKQVAGLWTHEADQPDVLCLVPRYWPMASGGQWMPYDSVVRRAMILARSDRGRDAAKRTRAEIAEVLSYEWRLDPGKAGATIGEPGWEDRAEEAYARAYARYPMWPRFWLEGGVPAGRERVGTASVAELSSATPPGQLLSTGAVEAELALVEQRIREAHEVDTKADLLLREPAALDEDAQVRVRAAFDAATKALERLDVAEGVLNWLLGSEPRRPSAVAIPSLDGLPSAAAGELPLAER